MDDSQTPERCVLEGVPRIHFYEGGPFCPEDICFPSALKTCLEFMGDPIGCKHTSPPTRGLASCGYSYLVGTSGEAFALCLVAGLGVSQCDPIPCRRHRRCAIPAGVGLGRLWLRDRAQGARPR